MAAKKKATKKRATKKKVRKKKATKKKLSQGVAKPEPIRSPLGAQAKLYLLTSESHPGLIGVGKDLDPETNLSLIRNRYRLSADWKIIDTTEEFPLPVAELIVKDLFIRLQSKAVSSDRPIFSISKTALKRILTSVRKSTLESLAQSEISSKAEMVDNLKKRIDVLNQEHQRQIRQIREDHGVELININRKLRALDEELNKRKRKEQRDVKRLKYLERQIKDRQARIRQLDSVLEPANKYLSGYEKKLVSEVRKLAKKSR